MLNITIEGNQGEGKSITARAIVNFWKAFDTNKKVYLIEGYTNKSKIPNDVNVLIKVIQYSPESDIERDIRTAGQK